MSLFDRNGVRIGPEDGKPDVVIPGMEDIRELQKLRDDFDKYRAEEAAYHAAEALREKRAETRGFWKGVFSAIIAGVIVAAFTYCLPLIVSLFTKLFQ